MRAKCMITFILWILWMPVNAQSFYTENGYARFGAKSNLDSYQGISNQLTGEVNLATRVVHFKVPVNSFDTGNDKRNRDMNKLLKTDQNPEAEFYGEITSPFNKSKSGVQQVAVSGIFHSTEPSSRLRWKVHCRFKEMPCILKQAGILTSAIIT